ncbi:DUF4129 domain-containing protein [Streptomyces fuscigenes]|uniref:DUF4129 domain-containing protein n=1 Tax=Streptomyces fuscigenes TaxID=1528880 RepID=UPI001F277146|nr:DUF4129 domain-containing protein [Streptomyces fuscigenes]MCF3961653.1 DUF4129 domain-containing protein [Streptomyces fuscigenes]
MTATGGTSAGLWLTGGDGHVPLVISREAARREAQRELSKAMYHQHDPNLLQRAIRSFLDWIGDLLDSASGVAPGGHVGVVVVAVAVVVLVGALWWRLGTPRRTASAAVDGALFDDAPRSAADHRKAAESHAAAARWREAAQERMRAVVGALEERALLDPRPGRTATEAATEAGRPLPKHADRLRAAAGDFNSVTYGGHDADRAMYERIRELDDDLRRARPSFERPVETTVAVSPPS